MKRIRQALVPLLGLLSCWAGAQTNTAISTTPRYQQTGRVDYVALGASFRVTNGNGSNICTIRTAAGTGAGTTNTGSSGNANAQVTGNAAIVTATQRTGLQQVPSGATVRAAYLYWEASQSSSAVANADRTVTFTVGGTATTVNADRVWTGADSGAGSMGAVANVTALVQANPNADMRMDGLDIQNNGNQCGNGTVHGSWTLYIVYENQGLSSKTISFFDGLNYIGGSSGVANISIPATGFTVPSDAGKDRVSKATIMVADGDYDATGESFSLQSDLNTSATVQTSPNRPANNFFVGLVSVTDEANIETRQGGSTVTTTAAPATATTTGGLDIATINAPSSVLPAGTKTITATIASPSGELLLVHSIVLMANTSDSNVRIVKTLQGNQTTYVVGAPLSFILAVDASQGSYEALSVVTTDTLPKGLTYNSTDISYDGGATWTALSGVGSSVDATTGVTTLTFPSVRRIDPDGKVWGGTDSIATQLGSQNVRYRVNATGNGDVIGELTNQASVSTASFEATASKADNTSSAKVTVNRAADLTLTKTDGVTTVARGDIANYTIVLTNNGPASANGTVLTDPAVTGLSKTRVICTASGNAACPALTVAGLESGVTVATLPSGGSLTLTVSASVTASSGSVTNSVTAALPSGTVDPTPTGTVSDTDTATLPASICSARGGTLGTNLLASQGTFGTVAAGSSVEPPTVRKLSDVSTAPSTDYNYNTRTGTRGNTSPEDGEYNISNSTGFRRDGAWYIVHDHTSGTSTGQMMVVNAGTNLGVFYQETVTVTPNTNYELSSWIINLIANNAATLPNFSIQLDRIGFDDDNDPKTADGAEGQIVYRSGDIPNSSVPIWRNAGYIFNSGAATQITVRFRNNNPGGGGNDLALDDLSFTPCTGLPIGSISGTLYKDRNNNGAFDTAPDSRLGQNIAVALTDSNSGVTSTVYTDANGNYTFSNVPAATYTVGVITADPDLGGLTPNTPSTAQYTNVALASGANIVREDFGFNAAGLTLNKTVRNCTSDIKANRPCAATFGTNVTGLPKDILEYCIDYKNTGSGIAENVVVTDNTPVNTQANLDGYGSGLGIGKRVGTTTTLLTSTDADNDGGAIVPAVIEVKDANGNIKKISVMQASLKVGTLNVGEAGTLCFRVTIN